ncbi:hypothetical protein BDZ91DRAFT_838582 [Kalaharituber pfeilii]|nr:hypothetical protein BDZ91DRAFT_838582 [Kalaharituber pfeilii]
MVDGVPIGTGGVVVVQIKCTVGLCDGLKDPDKVVEPSSGSCNIDKEGRKIASAPLAGDTADPTPATITPSSPKLTPGPMPNTPKPRTPSHPRTKPPTTPPTSDATTTSKADIVVHGIALRKDLGKVRRLLEAVTKDLGRITGIRWLRKKDTLVNEGKTTSSAVVYLEKTTEVGRVRLGGRWLRVDQYAVFPTGQA